MRNRAERINQLLKQKIAEILARDFFVEKTMVTVQGVNIGKDLRRVKVRVSVMPFSDSEKVLKKLTQQLPRIQEKLGDGLRMKFTPRIQFLIDSSEENADRVEKILKFLKNK